MGKKYILKKTIVFCISVVFILFIINGFQIKLSVYTYTTSKVGESFRILQITDLHSREFGENNSRLINKIAKQHPDIIFMTGDMLTDTDTSHDIVVNLAKEAVKVASVYYSMGNHENDYSENDKLVSELEASGVNVIRDRFEDIEVNGNKIRILGAYTYIGAHFEEEVIWEMQDFEKTENLKIILSHVPSRFVNQEDDWWDYDLVFSGHYHGGQVRMPFVGGVKTPEGWFPEYDMGEYKKDNYTVYISSGLGSEGYIPRINNPPEILVVDVVPEGREQ